MRRTWKLRCMIRREIEIGQQQTARQAKWMREQNQKRRENGVGRRTKSPDVTGGAPPGKPEGKARPASPRAELRPAATHPTRRIHRDYPEEGQKPEDALEETIVVREGDEVQVLSKHGQWTHVKMKHSRTGETPIGEDGWVPAWTLYADEGGGRRQEPEPEQEGRSDRSVSSEEQEGRQGRIWLATEDYNWPRIGARDDGMLKQLYQEAGKEAEPMSVRRDDRLEETDRTAHFVKVINCSRKTAPEGWVPESLLREPKMRDAALYPGLFGTDAKGRVYPKWRQT